jgi:YD repeat-containing protein
VCNERIFTITGGLFEHLGGFQRVKMRLLVNADRNKLASMMDATNLYLIERAQKYGDLRFHGEGWPGYPDGQKHYYEYDLARQRTAMADPTGRTAFGYDNLGRMTFRGNPGSQNLYYEYDAAGNRTSLKNPDGALDDYTYDAVNRMTLGRRYGYGTQAYGTTPYGGQGASYEYDLANQFVHETRSNGSVVISRAIVRHV